MCWSGAEWSVRVSASRGELDLYITINWRCSNVLTDDRGLGGRIRTAMACKDGRLKVGG